MQLIIQFSPPDAIVWGLCSTILTIETRRENMLIERYQSSMLFQVYMHFLCWLQRLYGWKVILLHCGIKRAQNNLLLITPEEKFLIKTKFSFVLTGVSDSLFEELSNNAALLAFSHNKRCIPVKFNDGFGFYQIHTFNA
jgi:hypothetical protein